MIIFIVTIRTAADGRYIDSLWVVQQHAVDRVAQLTAELKRTGRAVNQDLTASWHVWWSKATVEDARLDVQKNTDQ